ncbi:DUF3168 domain-containing protein [Brevundimonas sp. PAMC22021]|uniref:DUF3168 domain-containing protein n=1 Tax=Brevundimonas sp. PAMC22021 TaxID=2861285 RepID=UPI001C631B27|nr:DUF3168 domain-containing protein [Brevundimonas sp. PAMC22021]QYF86030.1 DUF3168 domain-containing protein [Brevundimonas sp. PAMC22021]
MSDHEGALQRALIERLRSDTGIRAVLGDPARVWDQPPGANLDHGGFPRLLVGRGESRPVAADGCGIEHRLTLTAVSRFPGLEEARRIAGAVRAALEDAVLEADGVRTVSVAVVFSDVFRTGDWRRTQAVLRVRAVTEDIRENE